MPVVNKVDTPYYCHETHLQAFHDTRGGPELEFSSTAGFTIFPSFVALVHKKLYVDHSCLVVGLAMSPLTLADL